MLDLMPQFVESPRLLIVDDDAHMRGHLKDYLLGEGFEVSEANNANTARRVLHSDEPDLVLLDVNMPGEDGISLCRSMARSRPIPTIFVSGRNDDVDRIIGLEVGADDYVCKPYNPRELLARIRSVLRRARGGTLLRSSEQGNLFEFDRWVFDLARRKLTRDDNVVVSLSSSEFHLLKVFLSRPGIVLTRDRILELTRIEDEDVFDRSVDSQISRFRRKLEQDPKNPQLIKTIWGGGYMFAADVKRL